MRLLKSAGLMPFFAKNWWLFRERTLRIPVPGRVQSYLEIIRFAEHRSYRIDRIQGARATGRASLPASPWN